MRWGILGTGSIAGTLAEALARSQTGELVAVGSRTAEGAEHFARQFGVPRAHATYESLLADANVDVVYIATPHPWHAHWAVLAAEAKKHILCEKPLAMNHAQVTAMVRAAREHDVFLMEAFMYRCQSQTRELVSLVRGGAIGRVKAIHASFGIDPGVPASHRLFDNELGGGGILDLGCYPASLARLVAGVAVGEAFSEPLELFALGHVGDTSRVDEYSVAICRFPGDVLATLATGVRLAHDNGVRIFGSAGRIWLRNPWHPPHGGVSEMCIERPGREPEMRRFESAISAYTLQVDAVAAQIEVRQAAEMSWADSLGNARLLDRWRAAVGVEYAADRALG